MIHQVEISFLGIHIAAFSMVLIVELRNLILWPWVTGYSVFHVLLDGALTSCIPCFELPDLSWIYLIYIMNTEGAFAVKMEHYHTCHLQLVVDRRFTQLLTPIPLIVMSFTQPACCVMVLPPNPTLTVHLFSCYFNVSSKHGSPCGNTDPSIERGM